MADLDEAALIIATLLGDVSCAPQQRHMLDRLLPLVTGDLPMARVGALNVPQWQRNLATYAEFGLINQPLATHAVLDSTLLPIGV